MVKGQPTGRDVGVPAAAAEGEAEAKVIKFTSQEADAMKPNASPAHPPPPTSPFPKISLQKPLGSPFVSHLPFSWLSIPYLSCVAQKTRGFADFAGNKSPFGAFAATQTSVLKSDRPIWTLNNQNAPEEIINVEFKEEPEHVLTQAVVTAKPIANR